MAAAIYLLAKSLSLDRMKHRVQTFIAANYADVKKDDEDFEQLDEDDLREIKSH